MNEKLTNCFAEALGIEPTIVNDELAYRGIKEWDSIAHMSLVALIESEFDIMLDTNDIIDMSSVGKAKSILGKYGVTF
jgi:acyl carrier protein